MARYIGKDIAEEHLLDIAVHCVHAAYKAPQITGRLKIQTEILTGEDLKPLIEVFAKVTRGLNPIFHMDSSLFTRLYEKGENFILLLIGADLRVSEMGWNCGACGFGTCAEFNRYVRKSGGMGRVWDGPSCNWKAMDFGIVLDWAAAAAGQHKVPNRIVGTVGSAAKTLGYLPGCSAIVTLPMGPLRELVYFSREELQDVMTYEEHKEALLRSVPTHFSAYAEQWRLILKRKEKWWEDPDLLKWGKEEEEVTEDLRKVGEEVTKVVKKYKPEIQKIYAKK